MNKTDGEVLFEDDVLDASGAILYGCAFGGVVAALVTLAVSLFALAGNVTASLASGLKVIIPLCVVAAIGLGVWARKVKRRSSRRLVVSRCEAGVRLVVAPELDVRGPVELGYGWFHIPVQRGMKMKMLWCDVTIDGDCVARLSHQLGAIYPPPDDWDEMTPPSPPTAKHGFTIARIEEFVARLRP